MSFHDDESDWNYTVPSSPDATFCVADHNDTDLANFFARPVKIGDYPWEIGVPMYFAFNPWSAYFSDKRVINRIANFNLLRAKLHLKFLINGNSFYYGRAIFNYRPLQEMDDFTMDRGFFEEDIVEASQRPHLYLDPTTNQGGTMELPFVYPYNAVSIPFSEWGDLAFGTLRSIQDLKHANGATDGISISVFAWLSEVHLAVPTGVNPSTISPQSGDEYTEKPISTPAAIVANVAGQLSHIPILRPYALATQMVASATASLAKSFGYSRPVSVADTIPVRWNFGNYSNTNVTDNSHKLALDIKQETTIDSRVCGLDGADEMSIRSIATREAWIDSFPWSTARVADDVLFSTIVTPIQHREVAGPPREFHMTPVCFATLPFKYWRGSLKYRFQIVSSGFHKGRLKISWDPASQPTSEFNVAYTQIVDISTEKDFTVTVGWGSKYPFLRYTPPEATFTTRAKGQLVTFPAPEFFNGVLSVSVVNELTVPMSTIDNTISVNVMVSAGDDFEVAVPDPTSLNSYTYLRPPDPITITAQSGDANEESSKPILDYPGKQMGSSTEGTPEMYHIMFGDPIASVRQIVKRFSLHSVLVPQRAGDCLSVLTRADFPYYQGALVAGPHGLNDEAYAQTTFINWFTPAYVCRRGGIRWKYWGVNMDHAPEGVSVQRSDNPPFYDAVLSLTGTVDAVAKAAYAFPNLRAGGVINPVSQPVAEVELPYYTNKRFWAAKSKKFTNSDCTQSDTHDIQTITRSTAGGSASMVLGYVAAADDFSLSFFTGAPVMYYFTP